MTSTVSPRHSSDAGGGLRILVLVTDAFGGRGGIAQFNRDLLGMLCLHPGVMQVTALPRVIAERNRALPSRLVYETGAARGKVAYVCYLAKLLAQRDKFEGIVCGHLHLLPFAAIAAGRNRIPLILITHGIEAWRPPRIPGLRRSLRAVDSFVSVSRLTKERFLDWAGLKEEQGHVIPNCINTSRFRPGPKPTYLLQRYGLTANQVLMTVARLSTPDRYKGIDEVLEVLPSLVREIPNLKYLIAGDGHDRHRLQSKVAALGLGQCVVFAGYVSEEEKADHYCLADAFVMPGRGEGFGIVYLEAMACGIPVVASKADASREAVLEGKLGQIVDPGNLEEIQTAIRKALRQPREVPPGLDYFSVERFTERWHPLIDHTFASKNRPPTNSTREEVTHDLHVAKRGR